MTGSDPGSLTGSAQVRIGTAGWSIPKPHAAVFADAGTHLQRYAGRFNAVEINSSFYRPHKPETYARWAAAVPPGFRFAVKLPREITHTRRLTGIQDRLDCFLEETQLLAKALGPLLVQLPPSLRFDSTVAGGFFDLLRGRFSGHVVCEPRHPPGLRPRSMHRSPGTTLPGLWRTPPRCHWRRRPAVIPVSPIAACMARREPTTRPIRQNIWKRWPGSFRASRRPPGTLVHLRQHGRRPRHPRCARPGGTRGQGG